MNSTFKIIFAVVFVVVAFVSSRFIRTTPDGFRRAYAENPLRTVVLHFVVPVLLIGVFIAFLMLSGN